MRPFITRDVDREASFSAIRSDPLVRMCSIVASCQNYVGQAALDQLRGGRSPKNKFALRDLPSFVLFAKSGMLSLIRPLDETAPCAAQEMSNFCSRRIIGVNEKKAPRDAGPFYVFMSEVYSSRLSGVSTRLSNSSPPITSSTTGAASAAAASAS